MAGHENFVAKIQRMVGPQLQEGEVVQEACAGLTEGSPVSGLGGLIAMVKLVRGNGPKNMVVLLTDRSLHLAHAYVTIGMKSAEIVRTFPRAEAAADVRLRGNTLTVGDQDVIVAAIAHREAAKRITAAVAPAR